MMLCFGQISKEDCIYFNQTSLGKVVSPDVFIISDSLCIAGSMSNIMGKRFYVQIKIPNKILLLNGAWDKGNTIVFYLTDGEAITMKNDGATLSLNALAPDTNSKVFSFQCKTNSYDVGRLRKAELLKVEVEWRKKTKEYSVTNKKIFINQIPCIE